MLKDFGERLRKARKSKGLTQAELANAAGIGTNTIARYESGERQPTIEMLYKICDAIKVSPDYLLGKTPFMGNYFPGSGFAAERIDMENPELLRKYLRLNNKGKNKVNEYVDDIYKIDEYTKPDNED